MMENDVFDVFKMLGLTPVNKAKVEEETEVEVEDAKERVNLSEVETELCLTNYSYDEIFAYLKEFYDVKDEIISNMLMESYDHYEIEYHRHVTEFGDREKYLVEKEQNAKNPQPKDVFMGDIYRMRNDDEQMLRQIELLYKDRKEFNELEEYVICCGEYDTWDTYVIYAILLFEENEDERNKMFENMKNNKEEVS